MGPRVYRSIKVGSMRGVHGFKGLHLQEYKGRSWTNEWSPSVQGLAGV